ncbi:tripartite tricarboxylate transporter substrate binding protein [Variovorax rhizosphaerae]|uniref:Tripartite tricarboxylate transporter substrate binding protein n=1 Tax=Variovorax rhizosphaerae TaxID=1836200 RepID=A0ABU8WUE4_9BURK
MIQRKHLIQAALLSLTLGMTGQACAQGAFPSKPLRIIVTFGAGGSGDLLARALGQELGEILGQPVIVENRAGGNAIPGTEYAAKAPADGYTILEYSSTLAVNMALQPGLPYDLFRDFTPVAYTFEAPLVLLTPATGPYQKVSELVAFAKANSKGVSFGHGGVGSMSHLSGELFKRSMGIDAVSVAYKGNAPAMTDLIGGRLDYYFATVSDVLPNIKAGRLHALAVTSTQRDPTLPSVPTMVELGYKDFTPTTSWGFLVPKNTPPVIVRQLQDGIAKALGRPAMQERLAAVGANSRGAGGPDVLTARMKSEIARWEPVIKAAHIKPE